MTAFVSYIKKCRSFLLVAILPSLSGCFSYYSINDHVSVCYDKRFSSFERQIEGATVRFHFVAEIANRDEPIDKDVFWVRMVAWNEGRKSYMREHGRGFQWTDGKQGIPILYSTENAFVESDEGAVVHADPGLYFNDAAKRDKPGQWIKNGAVDINSDEIQRANKPGTSLYGRVYLRFKMLPPKPQAQWKLHLGRVSVDGQLVDLPVLNLCTIKGRSGWYRASMV